MKNLNWRDVGKSITKAAAAAAKGTVAAAHAAQEGITVALGSKLLRDYDLCEQQTSVCHGLWHVYRAKSKKPGAAGLNREVSAWILDRKTLPTQDGARRGQRSWDDFMEVQKAGVANLVKLRHPSVLKVLEPLEEHRGQLIMVTESISCSLHNLLHPPADASDAVRALQLSALEIKHGMHQLAMGLHFLHTEANLVHRNLDLDAAILTTAGAWKLVGLGFCVPVSFGDAAAPGGFHYHHVGVPLSVRLSMPSLSFVAPELMLGPDGPQPPGGATTAADIWSLGAVVFEVLTRRPLMDVGDALEYRAQLPSLANMPLHDVPAELHMMLRTMLSTNTAQRPSAAAFSSNQYFQQDQLLRALRFLDSILQKDANQKANFFKDLASFWSRFDGRVLRYKVLPALLQESKSPQLQALTLPLIFQVIAQQDAHEFRLLTLPELRPILDAAAGDSLRLVARNAGLLAEKLSEDITEALPIIMPIAERACDSKDPRTQEEVLRQLAKPEMEALLSQGAAWSLLLPRLHSMCLRTTSAAVRGLSLAVLAGWVPQLPEQSEGDKCLTTLAQVTAVDKTPGTMSRTLQVADALVEKWGAEYAAKRVLPLLLPLAASGCLPEQLLARFMAAARKMLDGIEARGRAALVKPAEAAPKASATAHGSDADAAAASWDDGPLQPMWMPPASTTPPEAKPSPISNAVGKAAMRSGAAAAAARPSAAPQPLLAKPPASTTTLRSAAAASSAAAPAAGGVMEQHELFSGLSLSSRRTAPAASATPPPPQAAAPLLGAAPNDLLSGLVVAPPAVAAGGAGIGSGPALDPGEWQLPHAASAPQTAAGPLAFGAPGLPGSAMPHRSSAGGSAAGLAGHPPPASPSPVHASVLQHGWPCPPAGAAAPPPGGRLQLQQQWALPGAPPGAGMAAPAATSGADLFASLATSPAAPPPQPPAAAPAAGPWPGGSLI